jgi:hypothetical protein
MVVPVCCVLRCDCPAGPLNAFCCVEATVSCNVLPGNRKHVLFVLRRSKCHFVLYHDTSAELVGDRVRS